MNIHCSACGAPLPTGARFCISCALPLTAIAMPTLPARPPRRRQVSILAILLGAFAIFWAVAYVSDRYAAAKPDLSSSSAPSIGIDPTFEQHMENATWFSAPRLRAWRSDVLKDAQRLRSSSSPAAPAALRDDQAALARIDARLKAMEAR